MNAFTIMYMYMYIHAGSDHLTLLTEHGDVYTLGCAEQGQLGRVPECFRSKGKSDDSVK